MTCPSRKTPDERTNGYTIDLVNGDIIAPNGWNEVSVSTDEEKIDNYLLLDLHLAHLEKKSFPLHHLDRPSQHLEGFYHFQLKW